MTSIPCDLVLLPDDTLAEKAIIASKLLAEHDTLFTLEIGKVYPHMSLYMFQLDEENIQLVEERMTTLASMTQAVTGTATNYRVGEGWAVGYVDPEYAITDELHSIQNSVIDAINPIRAGMRQKDIAKMEDATGLKLENLQKYGYPSIGELFRPHMTLTRLTEYKPEVVDVLPDISTFTGTFNRIGLFEMGDNGTCVRKIAEFSLSSGI